MTEQTFTGPQQPAGAPGGAPGGSGNQGPGKPPAAASPAAKQAEIKAAVEFVLKSKANEIGTWCTTARGTKVLEVRLAHIPAGGRRDLWVAVFKQLITLRGGAVITALKALAGAAGLDAAVATTLGEILKVKHGLTQADVTVAAGAKPSLPEGTVAYIDGFAYDTAFYKAASQALLDLQQEIADYAQRPAVLEAAIEAFRQDLAARRLLLDTTVQAADGILQTVTALHLDPFLGLLTGPLITCCQTAKGVLALDPELTFTELDTKLVATCVSTQEQQKKLIADARSAATSACSSAHIPLRSCLLRLDPDVIQRLAPLGLLPPQSPARKSCLTLTGVYGTPWLLCLSALKPAQVTLLLDRCAISEVSKQLTIRVKPADTGLLSKAVAVLANPDDEWDVACGKVVKLDYQNVPLPNGVQAMGWLSVGQCWLPGAFGTASMETDFQCLKHVPEELGANPSPAKAAQYFADLVSACLAACAGWSGAHEPATFVAAPLVLNGATWTVHVRRYHGKPQVFHVDSGYQNSPWVKRAL